MNKCSAEIKVLSYLALELKLENFLNSRDAKYSSSLLKRP